ncbi:MAG: YitT family protein [Chitinophagaceae bacterium]
MPKVHLPHWLQDTVYILSGSLFMAFALRSFLVPNHFIDGGVTGMSLLAHEIFHSSELVLALFIILANIPFMIMGGFLVNRQFALKSFAAVILLAICITVIPFPEFTDPTKFDRILVAVFGGFFLGIGIGLGMRGGSSLDGLEILALYTLRRSSFTISEIILGFNTVLFLLATLFVSFDIALYAILTYFVVTRTIDYVVEGVEAYTGVTIISSCSEEIKRRLVKDLGRGITIYKGERGFMKESFETFSDVDIVFSVITRMEVRRLRNVVQSIDPKAFVFTNTIREAAGGVLKRRVRH